MPIIFRKKTHDIALVTLREETFARRNFSEEKNRETFSINFRESAFQVFFAQNKLSRMV